MTAILGVLQSMIFSSSTLTLSLLKLIDLKITKPITTSKYNLKIVIALASIIIWFNFIFVESMGLFFNLTALFIVFAYATSILTLVIKKHNKTLMQKLITYSGLITAAIIFLNASYGVIEELVKF